MQSLVHTLIWPMRRTQCPSIDVFISRGHTCVNRNQQVTAGRSFARYCITIQIIMNNFWQDKTTEDLKQVWQFLSIFLHRMALKWPAATARGAVHADSTLKVQLSTQPFKTPAPLKLLPPLNLSHRMEFDSLESLFRKSLTPPYGFKMKILMHRVNPVVHKLFFVEYPCIVLFK